MQFRRSQTEAHTAALAEPWTLTWRTTNSFGTQPVRFRLEALMSAAPPDDTNAIGLGGFSGADAAKWNRSGAEGVSFTVSAARRVVEAAGVPPATTADPATSALLVATNTGKIARQGEAL